jgi:LacI family transcriptional regulator
MARLLRVDHSSRTIGMVIEDVGNPFFSAIIRAVERGARGRGYLVIAGSTDEDPAIERDLIRSLVEKRVEGLLVAPIGDDHRYCCPRSPAACPWCSSTVHPGRSRPTPCSSTMSTAPVKRSTT